MTNPDPRTVMGQTRQQVDAFRQSRGMRTLRQERQFKGAVARASEDNKVAKRQFFGRKQQ